MIKAILHTIVGIVLSYMVKYPNISGILIVSVIYAVASIVAFYAFN